MPRAPGQPLISQLSLGSDQPRVTRQSLSPPLSLVSHQKSELSLVRDTARDSRKGATPCQEPLDGVRVDTLARNDKSCAPGVAPKTRKLPFNSSEHAFSGGNKCQKHSGDHWLSLFGLSHFSVLATTTFPYIVLELRSLG